MHAAKANIQAEKARFSKGDWTTQWAPGQLVADELQPHEGTQARKVGEDSNERLACKGGTVAAVKAHLRHVPVPEALVETTEDLAGAILWLGSQPYALLSAYIRPEGMSRTTGHA